ncbi:MAG TPA: hypothetical protein VHS55_05890 [Solirubrobacteraceae bacterium]|jgi:hypothetical protein|nr:hypothetical protein [Solirubrobacteraceae bacterium]
MVMQEQSKRLAQPLQWTRAGRLAVIVTVVVLAVGTVVAVVASTKTETLAPGCIQVTFASTLGAAEAHPCGARAREVCANPAENPGLAEHGRLRDACRRAGLPYATG